MKKEKESIWMLPGYMDGLRQAGGLPIMLPLTTDEREIEQLLDMVEGVLFTGGEGNISCFREIHMV